MIGKNIKHFRTAETQQQCTYVLTVIWQSDSFTAIIPKTSQQVLLGKRKVCSEKVMQEHSYYCWNKTAGIVHIQSLSQCILVGHEGFSSASGQSLNHAWEHLCRLHYEEQRGELWSGRQAGCRHIRHVSVEHQYEGEYAEVSPKRRGAGFTNTKTELLLCTTHREVYRKLQYVTLPATTWEKYTTVCISRTSFQYNRDSTTDYFLLMEKNRGMTSLLMLIYQGKILISRFR